MGAVTDVSAAVYRVELEEPHADGTLTWQAITVVVATVRADGVAGLMSGVR